MLSYLRRHRILSRLLFGLLSVVIAAMVFDRYQSLRILNTNGPREAERLIAAIAPLRQEVGEHRRYGRVWHGSAEWLSLGGGTMEAYVPVHGDKTSGTLYIEDWDDLGASKIREIRFRPNGQSTWIDYKDRVDMKVYYGDELRQNP